MSTNQRLTVRNDDIKRYIQYLYDISGKPPTYVKDGEINLDDSYANAVKNKYAKEEEKDEKKKEKKLTWDAIQRQINKILNNENFKGFIRTTRPFGNHVSGDVREKILEYNKHNPFGSDFSDEAVKYYKNEIIKYANSELRWDDSKKRETYINQLDYYKKDLDEKEADDNNVDGLLSPIHSAMEKFNNIVNNNTLDGVIVYKDFRDKFTTLYSLFKEKFNSLLGDEEYYNKHEETINQIKDYIRNIDNLTSLEKNDNYDPNDGKNYASDIELIDTDTILRNMPIEYKDENLDDIRKYAGKRLAAMTHVSDDTYKDVTEDIYRRIKGNKYNHKQKERKYESFKDETENRIKINENRREMDNILYHRSQTFSQLGDFENESYGFRSNPMKSFERKVDEDIRDVISKATSPEFLDEIFGQTSEFPLEQSEEELPKDKEVSDGLTVDEFAESLEQTVKEINENEGIENEGIENEQPIEPEQPIENEHKEEEHQDDKKQLELSESSESSTIESVNEEEEYPEDENIHNEMNDSVGTPSNLQTLNSVNPPSGFANGGELSLILQPVGVDIPLEENPDEENPDEENPLAIQRSSLSQAGIEASNTGVNSMNQDRNDIGHQVALLETLYKRIPMIQYAQSATDTNNILGSIVSIFKELPNGVDDEIANKLSEAVGPDGKKLFESKEEAARFIAKMRALNGNRLSSIKGGGQKTGIQLNITNKVVSNMPRKPFIVDTHPIPYQY